MVIIVQDSALPASESQFLVGGHRVFDLLVQTVSTGLKSWVVGRRAGFDPPQICGLKVTTTNQFGPGVSAGGFIKQWVT